MSGDTVDSIEIQYSVNLVSDKAGSCINPVSISSRLGAWPRAICELTTVVTTTRHRKHDSDSAYALSVALLPCCNEGSAAVNCGASRIAIHRSTRITWHS